MPILKMLTYRRPAGSDTEKAFIEEFIAPFKPVVMSQNQVVVVPGDPFTLFSCHTDTVHREGGMQPVIYDAAMRCAYKDDGEPLGGDNTAGVWILLEMIRAGVPGTYLFHYGEEKGCIGSGQLADDEPAFLKQFKRAIAFDRRGTTSVITHQMHTRCCSHIFGQALADRLCNGYTIDPTGLYTDTAQYTHLIPECTNVSVGYGHEHTKEEFLDVEHLELLRDVAIAIDWSTLPTERVCVESAGSARRPKYTYAKGSYYSGNYGGVYGPEYDDIDDVTYEEDELILEAYNQICSQEEAYDLCITDPEMAAAMLYAFVYDRDQRIDVIEANEVREAAKSDAAATQQSSVVKTYPALPSTTTAAPVNGAKIMDDWDDETYTARQEELQAIVDGKRQIGFVETVPY